jgi:hypothetical protein
MIKSFFIQTKRAELKVNTDHIDNVRRSKTNDIQYPEISFQAHINIKHVSIH